MSTTDWGLKVKSVEKEIETEIKSKHIHDTQSQMLINQWFNERYLSLFHAGLYTLPFLHSQWAK